MLNTPDGERGQVIILFVVMFSVILVLAMFAIDQGFWYGRRRVVQKDADLAARSGALVYIGNLSNTSGAASQARTTAQDNGVASGDVTATGSSSCTPQSGATISGAPSVEVTLQTQARSFFSGLGLISDDGGPIDVGAVSRACVGSVARLYAANGDDPVNDDNTLKAIPIALRRDSPNTTRSCFSGTTLRTGFECVIFQSLAQFGPNPPHSSRRTLFRDPRSDECFRNGSPDADDIEDGVSMTCLVTTANNCGGGVRTLSCVRTSTVNNSESAQHAVFDAMTQRLDNSTSCATREGGEPFRSFQNAFGNGDGLPDNAPDPPGLGGSGAPGHVYVQNDCYDNPRIVVLPIVSGGNDGGAGRPVRGFAVVYITGCYDKNDNSASTFDKETNDCHDHHPLNDCDDPVDADAGCFVEIRGIPVHTFISDPSLGGINTPTVNAPLTIQTVK